MISLERYLVRRLISTTLLSAVVAGVFSLLVTALWAVLGLALALAGWIPSPASFFVIWALVFGAVFARSLPYWLGEEESRLRRVYAVMDRFVTHPELLPAEQPGFTLSLASP